MELILVIAAIALAIAILVVALAVGIVGSIFYGIYLALKNCVLAINENINNKIMQIILYMLVVLFGLAIMGTLAMLTVWLVSVLI